MNPADIAVIAVLLISGILALFRGFVREVLSIGGWIAAAGLTIVLFPRVQPFAREYIDSELAADITAGALLFIGLLILFGVICTLLARVIQGSALSAVDRSLGFVFGLVRGAILVSLAYLVLIWFFPSGEEPDWLTEARTQPLVAEGASFLYSLVPEETLAQASESLDRGIRERLGSGIDLPNLSRPQPNSDEAAPEGYDPSQSEELERVIDGGGGN